MTALRTRRRAAAAAGAFARWFAQRGWTPRAHQLELLAQRPRRPLGAADRADRRRQDAGGLPAEPGGAARARRKPRRLDLHRQGAAPLRQGLHTLYISPLKALAVDIARNLETPVAEMGLPIRIETRTGDTPDLEAPAPAPRSARHPADHARAAGAAARLAPTRRICSARSSASCSTSCMRWSPPSAAICCRSAWRGCSRLAPELTTIGLSATVAEPDDLRRFLVPQPRARRGASPISSIADGGAEPRRHHARARRASALGRAFGAPRASARSTS